MTSIYYRIERNVVDLGIRHIYPLDDRSDNESGTRYSSWHLRNKTSHSDITSISGQFCLETSHLSDYKGYTYGTISYSIPLMDKIRKYMRLDSRTDGLGISSINRLYHSETDIEDSLYIVSARNHSMYVSGMSDREKLSSSDID